MVLSRLAEDQVTWLFGRVRGLRPTRGRGVADAAMAGHGATPLAHCRSAGRGVTMGWCEELWNVLIVLDPAGAEGDLTASAISCPSCASGRLRPWGYARYPGPTWSSWRTSYGAFPAGAGACQDFCV